MHIKIVLYCLINFLLFCLSACKEAPSTPSTNKQKASVETVQKPSIVVLGTVQDAGYPQIGCLKACCKERWQEAARQKLITCLGLVDPQNKQSWLFEASPDFKKQSMLLNQYSGKQNFDLPEGVFLTHGHIGHYVGLMYLGRESMNAQSMNVYAMPQMQQYLQSNGPWSQLVALNNIAIQALKADSVIVLNEQISVIPFLVPHRGEYTETVGYKIVGPSKKILFIPDIDKWNLWDRSIADEIAQVDVALLDATFFKNGEVGNRDMSEIPHPFVEESMQLFDQLAAAEKSKIHFIHFNHTNPLLVDSSTAAQEVLSKGYKLAKEGMVVEL